MLLLLTAEYLESKGACAAATSAFRRAWPGGLDLADTTTEGFVIEVAVLAELDFDWAARNILPASAYKAYSEAIAPARKAYSEAIAPARKAYSEASASADKAYSEAIAPAYKAYSEAVAPAYKAYSEAVAPADKAYSEASASALLAAIRSGGLS